MSLINVKLSDGSWLVDGKNVTGFSIAEENGYAKDDVPWELEDRIKEHGAICTAVSPWQPYNITDGRLITGQNPASAQGVAERVIAVLEATKSQLPHEQRRLFQLQERVTGRRGLMNFPSEETKDDKETIKRV